MNVNPKVAAGGIAGAVSIALVWLLNIAAGVTVPPEVAAAFTTILSFAAGYWKRPPAVPVPAVALAAPTTTTAPVSWSEPAAKPPPPVKPVKKTAKKAKP